MVTMEAMPEKVYEAIQKLQVTVVWAGMGQH